MPAPEFTTDAFRDLVDRAKATLPLETRAQVEAAFADTFAGIQPAQRWQALQACMTDAVVKAGTGEAGLPTLGRLRRSMVYEAALGRSKEPYAGLLGTLAQSCKAGPIRALIDESAWITAINAARALSILIEPVPELPGREGAVMAAAQRLISRGATISVQAGRFSITPAEFDRLSIGIERRVKALGGLILVDFVMKDVERREPLFFGRYAPGRSFGHQQPSLPIGYLLQLGLKHLDARPGPKGVASAHLQHIVRDATDLCAVLDVEPYNNLEHIVLNPFEVPTYLGSVALYDHLFTLRQWPPQHAARLLAGALSGLDDTEVQRLNGWSLNDVYKLLAIVLAQATEPMKILTVQGLLDAGLPRDVWRRLEPDFVHRLGGVNRDYLTPVDAGKAEIDFKPLCALPNNYLLVVSPGLAALGFYEAATRAIRSAKYAQLDNRVGESVEGTIAERLRSSGLAVTVESQEYQADNARVGERDRECDLVVETDGLILFIELKKKPLRRISSGGDPVAGLVDLSASLFDAQAQLARHEIQLLRAGTITFKNGYVLEHRERRIERFAATWLDYGGLQDKVLLGQIFESLMGKKIGTEGLDALAASKVAQLNSSIAALSDEAEVLIELRENHRALFMNCWFLSAPQLVMLSLKGMVDVTGIEPVTPSMSTRCSPAELHVRRRVGFRPGRSRGYTDAGGYSASAAGAQAA
jgi:hypothetical protein